MLTEEYVYKTSLSLDTKGLKLHMYFFYLRYFRCLLMFYTNGHLVMFLPFF